MALVGYQHAQCSLGQHRIQNQRPKRCNQGVASEECSKPWDSGGYRRASLVRYLQRIEILGRSRKQGIKDFVIGLETGAISQPAIILTAKHCERLLEIVPLGDLRKRML